MLCEKCNHNQATVHYQQNINGEITQYHLCQDCANEMQLTPSFDNMFSDFLSDFSNPMTFTKKLSARPSCPTCGMTFDEIRQNGKLGCSDCYSTFSNELEQVLKNIHGTSTHNGKFPRKSGSELRLQHTLSDLRFKLKKAIEAEQYEDAAKLRDKIKELERGENND